MQTNALGVLRMTRACLPLLQKSSGGAILNVGSIAGRVAYENGAAYCGAKAAELQITKSLRLELCGTGLRVCTIDPGMAETEFSIIRFKGDEARAKKVYEGVEPLTAEDVAEALLWVAASSPCHRRDGHQIRIRRRFTGASPGQGLVIRWFEHRRSMFRRGLRKGTPTRSTGLSSKHGSRPRIAWGCMDGSFPPTRARPGATSSS